MTKDLFKLRQGWLRWRILLDKITTSPNYRYGNPKVVYLLKYAKFARFEMAHYNNLFWKMAQKRYSS